MNHVALLVAHVADIGGIEMKDTIIVVSEENVKCVECGKPATRGLVNDIGHLITYCQECYDK